MRKHERMIKYITNELQQGEHASKEELEAALQRFIGVSSDEIDFPEPETPEEKAEEMVDNAYDLPDEKGIELVREALKIDPDCVEAYAFLGEIEEDNEKALAHFEKGVEAAYRKFGDDFFEENSGRFWGLVKTRPFMRVKSGVGECCFVIGRYREAIKVYEEMLVLNPRDNQGVLYKLGVLYLIVEEDAKFRSLWMQYKTDVYCGWLYNYAISVFRLKGPSRKAEKALLKAIDKNIYVMQYVAQYMPLPDKEPSGYQPGEPSEAYHYFVCSSLLWSKEKRFWAWAVKTFEELFELR